MPTKPPFNRYTDPKPPNGNVHGLALCAGIGGLELGLKLALGEQYRTVGYVEREAYAASVLVARMEDQALDPAPVWDDLATFNGRPYRGKLDIVSSGLPCQPYSLAGKPKGNQDERAIWPEFIRITRETEPAAIFIENVPPFLHHFEPVYNRLRELGFTFAPPALWTAEEEGAPHIRRRLFILATHPDRTGLEEWKIQHYPKRPSPERSCRAPANANGKTIWIKHRRGEGQSRTQEIESGEHYVQPTPWQTESPILRVDDGPPYRVDRLRCIGNSVVPLVAARAFIHLSKTLISECANVQTQI